MRPRFEMGGWQECALGVAWPRSPRLGCTLSHGNALST